MVGWRLGRHRGFRVVGRLEAGEAPGGESKINLLSRNKLILVVPGRGKAGGWGGTGQGIQNQFVEPQQIDFGGSGRWRLQDSPIDLDFANRV